MHKILCAWCGVLIRDGKLPISHGCCTVCAQKLLTQMQQEQPYDVA